jgi:hypothetical protein
MMAPGPNGATWSMRLLKNRSSPSPGTPSCAGTSNDRLEGARLKKYTVIFMVLGALLFSACTTQAPPAAGATTTTPTGVTSPATSGIEGQITIGPTCPGPVRAESPCVDRPYPATITVLDQNREKVTQFQSGVDGKFHVPLPPGNYFLDPGSQGALPRAGEQAVTVTAGTFTQLQISYDTGIR